VRDNTLEEVRNFYDRIGWQQAGDGVYQNARYEDLRPVSQDYIHRCHLRVRRYLHLNGNLLLDAGSGPVQYPEYLTYSDTYQRRVCLDISIVALQEARKRLGEKGLYVVADVSRMPFKSNSFDGVVSLHTLHHLPIPAQFTAYREIYRVMEAGRTAVVVNGWTDSVLMRRLQWLIRLMERIGRQFQPKPDDRMLPGASGKLGEQVPAAGVKKKNLTTGGTTEAQTGTFVQKMNARLLRGTLSPEMQLEIRCWRSVSVRFLRAVVHRALAGRVLLGVLYHLEERFPCWFGEKGQYPMIIVRKN